MRDLNRIESDRTTNQIEKCYMIERIILVRVLLLFSFAVLVQNSIDNRIGDGMYYTCSCFVFFLPSLMAFLQR